MILQLIARLKPHRHQRDPELEEAQRIAAEQRRQTQKRSRAVNENVEWWKQSASDNHYAARIRAALHQEAIP